VHDPGVADQHGQAELGVDLLGGLVVEEIRDGYAEKCRQPFQRRLGGVGVLTGPQRRPQARRQARGGRHLGMRERPALTRVDLPEQGVHFLGERTTRPLLWRISSLYASAALVH
jgi:hypothetical protein